MTVSWKFSKEYIDILLEVCDIYDEITRMTGAENKLYATGIEDALIRAKNGEYIIKVQENADWMD